MTVLWIYTRFGWHSSDDGGLSWVQRSLPDTKRCQSVAVGAFVAHNIKRGLWVVGRKGTREQLGTANNQRAATALVKHFAKS